MLYSPHEEDSHHKEKTFLFKSPKKSRHVINRGAYFTIYFCGDFIGDHRVFTADCRNQLLQSQLPCGITSKPSQNGRVKKFAVSRSTVSRNMGGFYAQYNFRLEYSGTSFSNWGGRIRWFLSASMADIGRGYPLAYHRCPREMERSRGQGTYGWFYRNKVISTRRLDYLRGLWKKQVKYLVSRKDLV